MGSISIGVVLLVISIFIASRVRSLLVGRSADPEIQATIDDIINGREGIKRVFNTITVQFGPDTMLAVKVEMHPGMSIEVAVQHINDMELELKARVPNLRWVFSEPDVAD